MQGGSTDGVNMLRIVLKTAAAAMMAASFNAGAIAAPATGVAAGAPGVTASWWPTDPYCPPFMPRRFCPKA